MKEQVVFGAVFQMYSFYCLIINEYTYVGLSLPTFWYLLYGGSCPVHRSWRLVFKTHFPLKAIQMV